MEREIRYDGPTYILVESHEDYNIMENRVGFRFKVKKSKKREIPEILKKHIPKEELEIYENSKKRHI